ncbi:MAG: Cna B-type domain-containing protein [Clostridia bacterium]|nr:Cna B-type domain-containing protein [Clostridia bacterium]
MANFKTKKAIIAAVTAAILVIIAATGTVVYLKNKANTEATGTENSQTQSQNNVTEENAQNTEQSNEQQEANKQNENKENTESTETNQTGRNGANNNNNNNSNNNNSNNNAVTTTNQDSTNNQTTTTDSIEGTTITRTEKVEIKEKKILEGHFVGWTPMGINADIETAKNINKTKPDEIVTTKTGDKTVKQGENVTYEIKVENKTNKNLKNIEVKDALDEEILDVSTVKYLEDSKEANIVENVLVWNIDIDANQTVIIKFEVTVKTNVEAGTILTNSVITNGKEISDEEKPETTVEEATRNIEGTKTWNDANDQDGIRPESINVVLNKQTGNEETTRIDTKVVTEKDNWSYKFENVPVYENGEEITYTISEEAVAGYNSEVNGYDITNTHTPEVTNINVRKVWSDSDNAVSARPESVEVELYVANKATGNKATLNAENKWNYTFENLNKFENKQIINYTVKELNENGNAIENNAKYNDIYTTTYSKDDDGLIVTNTINQDVLKPHINSSKQSSILSCEKGITTGNTVHEGDVIQYTITIKNEGKVPAKASFTDTLDSGLKTEQNSITVTLKDSEKAAPTVNVKGNTLSFENYELESGALLTITINAEVKELQANVYRYTIQKNTATVTAEVGKEKEEEKPSDEKEYEVVKPNLETNKTSAIVECDQNQTTGKTVHEGDVIEYTITIKNNGTDSATVKTIEDEIPQHLTYVDSSLNVTVTDNAETTPEVSMDSDNRKVVLNKEYTLEAGKTITIKFRAKVDDIEEKGVYSRKISTNIVKVNNTPTEDEKGNYEEKKAQIEASKVVDKKQAEYGDILTYTIKAKNVSDVSTDATIKDTIPTGTEYIAGSITVNGEVVADDGFYSNGTITYTKNLPNKNDQVTLSFKVKVTETTIGKTIKNIATINDEEKNAETTVIKTVSVKATPDKPINLVLVLDVSGSMAGDRINDLISSAKKLANTALKNADSNSKVTLITYSSTATVVGTYEYKTKNSLENAINGLKANGGTNIYAGLNSAISAVKQINNGGETRVVFLTDGAPTIPSEEYVRNIDMDTNFGSGYTNNTKTKIVEKANELKTTPGVSKVYAIGVGVNNLSNTTLGYAQRVTTHNINSNIAYDNTNHTFTVTVTNPVDKQITIEEVNATLSRVDGIELDDKENGTVTENYNRFIATWKDITIPANGTVTLTGTYEPQYDYRNREQNPNNLSATTEPAYIADNISEIYKGAELYTETKTTGGVQYKGITTRNYAQYILGNISSTGTVMNVANASSALSDIEKDLEPETKTYTISAEGETTVEIPETREIISKVTVKIGDETNSYTLDELSTENGVNGLKYTSGVGFKWTVTNEKVLKNKLSIEYKFKAE